MTRINGRLRKQPRGQALVTMALSLVVLMGFAGLAIDVGLLMLTRNEVQNAADAAALSAAQYFYDATHKETPNWAGAEAQAATAIGFNKATKTNLVDGTITSGWWNLTGTPAGMQPQTKTPFVTGDAAAISVTIRKAPGHNGGSVALFLAPLMGISSEPLQANAVAVVSFPSQVAPNTTFPTAINACMYAHFWDFATNSPKIDPGTGNPYIFRIGSSYHYDTCDSGQWTSMLLDANDVPSVRGLIQNGNPSALSIGDSIWIEPGTKTSLYNDVIVPSVALLPVVQDVSSSTHAQTPIVGFGPFHIIASVGGSQKYIEGYFEEGYEIPKATGGGPNFGAVVPPTLVR